MLGDREVYNCWLECGNQIRSRLRTSLLVVGLAMVVGLSLALLFSITAPWGGPLVVSGHPLDAIIGDLGSGFFDR